MILRKRTEATPPQRALNPSTPTHRHRPAPIRLTSPNSTLVASAHRPATTTTRSSNAARSVLFAIATRSTAPTHGTPAVPVGSGSEVSPTTDTSRSTPGSWFVQVGVVPPTTPQRVPRPTMMVVFTGAPHPEPERPSPHLFNVGDVYSTPSLGNTSRRENLLVAQTERRAPRSTTTEPMNAAPQRRPSSTSNSVAQSIVARSPSC